MTVETDPRLQLREPTLVDANIDRMFAYNTPIRGVNKSYLKHGEVDGRDVTKLQVGVGVQFLQLLFSVGHEGVDDLL